MNFYKSSALLLSVALTACGGSDSSNEAETTNTDPSQTEIVGVYDASIQVITKKKVTRKVELTVDTVEVTNEVYVHIDSDGKMTQYDYKGDAYDNGSNCYVAGTVLDSLNFGGNIVSAGDGVFEIVSPSEATPPAPILVKRALENKPVIEREGAIDSFELAKEDVQQEKVSVQTPTVTLAFQGDNLMFSNFSDDDFADITITKTDIAISDITSALCGA